jgi:hypothetical protein
VPGRTGLADRIQEHAFHEPDDSLGHRLVAGRAFVVIERIARCFVPSSVRAPQTMFVPPRSTPMMYCSRPVVMRVRQG